MTNARYVVAFIAVMVACASHLRAQVAPAELPQVTSPASFAPLPMAMEGRVYSQTFTVDWAGGNAPHLLSLDTNGGNSLPNGLSLRLDNGSWKIMGIPAVGSAGGPFGIGDDYFLDIFAQANFHGFPFGNDTFHTLKVVEAIVVTVASHGVLVEG
ncbi:MAG: hypothetical protein L6Q71_02310, partial [Planctomycetes bacterium]|nr:hypothetical protein [Planctomycetota bacterium]